MSNGIKSIVVYALVNRINERLENMKKYVMSLIISLIAMPAFAVCSIENAACTSAASSLTDMPSIEERYLPNHLENMQKPDAFAPKYHTPYYDMLINTEESQTTGAASQNYNSNCQFGVCLPEAGSEELPFE